MLPLASSQRLGLTNVQFGRFNPFPTLPTTNPTKQTELSSVDTLGMLTDATEEEAGVDLGIAGVAEAGPSTHEDNLIILHEMDIKGEEDEEDGGDEDVEEDEEDEEEGEDEEEQQEEPIMVAASVDIPTSTVEQDSICATSSDLDGFDGINAIKMETDNIFESGGKRSVDRVLSSLCFVFSFLVGRKCDSFLWVGLCFGSDVMQLGIRRHVLRIEWVSFCVSLC